MAVLSCFLSLLAYYLTLIAPKLTAYIKVKFLYFEVFMTALPVIVGQGGINAAGRTSFFQGYRRIIIDMLDDKTRQETFLGLACLMNLVTYIDGQLIDQAGNNVDQDRIEALFGDDILAGTLIRKIENEHFDPDATPWQQKMTLLAIDNPIKFTLKQRELPTPIPSSWKVTETEKGMVEVEIHESVAIKHESFRDNPIKAAGQFPTGFDPAKLYNSRYQPRGLQATIFGAADAIHSTGFSWGTIESKVTPDEIGVYSASILGQVQKEGLGGLLKNRQQGDRVSTKNLALGLNTMSTDFINAYVTGSVGTTFSSAGACATFLYNLKAAVQDIKEGRIRVAIVGSHDCAITPEVIEGFGNMSALANEEGLKRLDGTDTADHRRTSRPFGQNCGFTLGEGAQYLVLMDDKLALDMGAKILGAVPDVFINADGVKKSITAPGPGNYITMAKSVALAQSIMGKESLQKRSFILAHGSSTPQNRVTESQIYDKVATSFDIDNWAVTAPKAYIGHTLGAASGDQMAVALGIFADNIMPGITTIDKVADDVFADRLNIATAHWECEPMDIAFINSKGFGGNNATATVLSPSVTLDMMQKRYGDEMSLYQTRLSEVEQAQALYKEKADKGLFDIIYRFGETQMDEKDISISEAEMSLPTFATAITLPSENPFKDMT